MKLIYYILSFTWGILFSLLGLISLPFALLAGGKAHKNGYGLIVEIGGDWGGVSFGPIAYCGEYSRISPNWLEHTRKHEFGHSIQNCLFGPAFLIVVAIPSFVRYWHQRNRIKRNLPNKPYDSIWFEGQATKWGTEAIEKIEQVYRKEKDIL